MIYSLYIAPKFDTVAGFMNPALLNGIAEGAKSFGKGVANTFTKTKSFKYTKFLISLSPTFITSVTTNVELPRGSTGPGSMSTEWVKNDWWEKKVKRDGAMTMTVKGKLYSPTDTSEDTLHLSQWARSCLVETMEKYGVGQTVGFLSDTLGLGGLGKGFDASKAKEMMENYKNDNYEAAYEPTELIKSEGGKAAEKIPIDTNIYTQKSYRHVVLKIARDSTDPFRIVYFSRAFVTAYQESYDADGNATFTVTISQNIDTAYQTGIIGRVATKSLANRVSNAITSTAKATKKVVAAAAPAAALVAGIAAASGNTALQKKIKDVQDNIIDKISKTTTNANTFSDQRSLKTNEQKMADIQKSVTDSAETWQTKEVANQRKKEALIDALKKSDKEKVFNSDAAKEYYADTDEETAETRDKASQIDFDNAVSAALSKKKSENEATKQFTEWQKKNQ